MIKIAAIYLILSFPGETHAVLALHMADMSTCEAERKAIQEAYKAASSRYVIFGHCVKSGFKNSN